MSIHLCYLLFRISELVLISKDSIKKDQSIEVNKHIELFLRIKEEYTVWTDMKEVTKDGIRIVKQGAMRTCFDSRSEPNPNLKEKTIDLERYNRDKIWYNNKFEYRISTGKNRNHIDFNLNDEEGVENYMIFTQGGLQNPIYHIYRNFSLRKIDKVINDLLPNNTPKNMSVSNQILFTDLNNYKENDNERFPNGYSCLIQPGTYKIRNKLSQSTMEGPNMEFLFLETYSNQFKD